MAAGGAREGGWASNPGVRASMQANTHRDTAPEVAVRRLLHAAGLRYRVDYPPTATNRRRRADIVFTRARVAVFVDGCFWHGCRVHYQAPKTNAAYWARKFRSNSVRDKETDALLTSEGWTVLRFWEHESPAEVAQAIVAKVRSLTG